MQRFFARIVGEEALFSPSEAHHLLDVMRLGEGDFFEVADEGEIYLAKLISRSPLKVHLEKKIEENNELTNGLLLGFSLLKGGHDELVLLKGTELGVKGFYPFIGERTIIKLDPKEKEKRLERFKKIVEEGAKQSKRTIVPFVSPILSYKELLETPADIRLIAYENDKENIVSLRKAFDSVKDGGNLLALVGPEGGFSSEEVTLATNKGFTSVGLGKRILRAETASIYLASAFSYAKEGQ
jgi:16S rRNA (uracil1498-N3)-methyltransferase